MSRISCKLLGGLGNQLFQAAVTLATAWKQSLIPVFEDNLPQGWQHASRPNYWSSVLHNVMLVTKLDKYAEYHEKDDHSFVPVPQITQNTLLMGYWQSAKYFDVYRDKIIDTFQLPYYYQKIVDDKIKIVSQQHETLAIHVRRTDYLHNRWELPLEYYKSAIKHISNNTVAIIFSDDHKWCKEHIEPLLSNFIKVVYSNELDYIELMMMSQCTHRIIANSSFSWWGAYLSKNIGKTIAPNPWLLYQGVGNEMCPDILSGLNWTTVDWRIKAVDQKLMINK